METFWGLAPGGGGGLSLALIFGIGFSFAPEG